MFAGSLADMAASQRDVRFTTKSGHSDPPKNNSRSALINMADDRALPRNGNASVAFRVAPMIGSS
jgi:hypothetical protein